MHGLCTMILKGQQICLLESNMMLFDVSYFLPDQCHLVLLFCSYRNSACLEKKRKKILCGKTNLHIWVNQCFFYVKWNWIMKILIRNSWSRCGECPQILHDCEICRNAEIRMIRLFRESKRNKWWKDWN